MNAIPQPVQLLLELFSTDLRDVRFADMDSQTLVRLAGEVRAAADAVMTAQAALDCARQALDEHQEILLQQSQRALAYARIYADGNDALSTRLDGVALPRSTRRLRGDGEALVLAAADLRAPMRRRGRPAKKREEALLPGTDEASAPAAE